MRVGSRTLRKGLGVALLATTGLAVAVGINTKTSAAADADLFGLQADVNPSTLQITPVPASYTLSNGNCTLQSMPSPVSTQLPGYLDVTTAHTGTCTVGATSQGTLFVAFCSTGWVTARWQLGEPDGDTVAFNADGVMVGGVAVLAAPPVALTGTGYWDPVSTASPGSGTGVALFLPSGTQTCSASSFIGKLTAAVVGVQ